MKYFDLHCDTAYEMYERACPYGENHLHLDRKKTSAFEPYLQVFSVWSDNRYSDDENFARFFRIVENAKNDPDFPPFILNAEGLKRGGAILGIEGAGLLSGKSERFQALYEAGMRVMTFAWEGENCTCGSHGTELGITPFGFEIASLCKEHSVIADLSHLSDKGIDGLLSVHGLPVMASHSLSRSVCPHSRNLDDRHLRAIADKGGIVGLSLVGSHLSANYGKNGVGLSELFEHFRHMRKLGGDDFISIGADLDGTQKLPREISDVGDIVKIRDYFEKNGVGDDALDKIFYTNAYRFFSRSMGEEEK